MTLSSIDPDQRDESAHKSDRQTISPPAQYNGRSGFTAEPAPKTSRATTTSHTARPAMWRLLTSKPPPARARAPIRATGASNAVVWSNLARDERREAPSPGAAMGLPFLADVSDCSGIGLLSRACSGRMYELELRPVH